MLKIASAASVSWKSQITRGWFGGNDRFNALGTNRIPQFPYRIPDPSIPRTGFPFSFLLLEWLNNALHTPKVSEGEKSPKSEVEDLRSIKAYRFTLGGKLERCHEPQIVSAVSIFRPSDRNNVRCSLLVSERMSVLNC